MPNTPEVWLNEFQANTTETGLGGNLQNDSTIIQLTNGNVVVLWTDNSDSGPGGDNGTDIIGQIYNPLGTAIGGEFLANAGLSADNEGFFSATALDNGRFVVVYEDTTAVTAIRATEWQTNAGGVVSSFSRTITAAPGGGDEIGGPAVAGNTTDGSYTIAYQYNDVSAGNIRTEVKHVDSAGTLGAAATSITGSNSFTQDSEIAILSDGTYVVVHGHSTGGEDSIAFSRLTSAGALTGGASFVTDTGSNAEIDNAPAVIGLTGGGFVIAWVNVDTDTDIIFQRYNNAGVEQGGVVAVSSAGSSDNNNEVHLVALADGGFVVVYDDDAADTINGQRFNATGGEVGSEFTITNSGAEFNPSGIGLQDGRFVVGWTTTAGPGVNVEIEFYDPRDNANALSTYTPDEWQVGTIGDDVFTATAGAEFVHGWDGNDTITEGLFVEGIFGDAGDDTIMVESLINSDSFDGGTGTDTIDWIGSGEGGATFDLHFGTATDATANVEQMTNFENLNGTNNADIINGTNGANVLRGNGGDDILLGRGGNDTMFGGAGDDRYYRQQGGDTMTENVGDGTDEVYSYINITLGANIENARLFGSANVANGNLLANRLIGRDGGDTLSGSGGNDFLVGNAGGDTLNGGADDDRLLGGNGADTLNGGSGQDRLEGGADIDTINAGNGDDVIFGGGHRDFMTGGTGADRFVFDDADYGGNTFALADRILDFDQAENDSIDLRPTDADTTTAGDQVFTFIASTAFSGSAGELRFIQSGGRTYVQGDTDGDGNSDFMIRLEGLTTLDVGDFLL